MNAPRPRSLRPPPPPKTQSGTHPAVREFRAKLDSIADGQLDQADRLDKELASFLDDLTTPLPTQKA